MHTDTEPMVTGINYMENGQNNERDYRAMKALLVKIDKRLMPLLMSLLFVSYLDRLNIGNARLLNIEQDLNLSTSQYNWAVSIFFVSYVLFEVPSNLMMRQVRPSIWISSLMVVWGAVMMLTSLVRDSISLYIGRFCLGAAEAGLFPGIIFYLTLWYVRKDQAFRIALFFSAGILAGAFAGLLAYIIEDQKNRKDLSGWQQMFLIEGGLTVLLACITFKFLTDYPATSSWLNQCHRDLLTARLRDDARVTGDDNEMSRLNAIQSAISDWKVLLFMLINMGALIPLFTLATNLPSIIMSSSSDHRNATAQLLTVPLYMTSFGASIFCGWNAGRLNERSTHIMVFHIIAIVGFLYLILAKTHLYIGIFLSSFGILSPYALIPSWVSANIAGKTKRAVAIALVTGFGCTGGIFSGQIYRSSDAAHDYRAHSILLGIMCFNFILILTMKMLLMHANKKYHDRLIRNATRPVLHQEFDYLYVT